MTLPREYAAAGDGVATARDRVALAAGLPLR